jgi:endogenous inhibitor of DNA gyrase (YacG/DUF329 family)
VIVLDHTAAGTFAHVRCAECGRASGKVAMDDLVCPSWPGWTQQVKVASVRRLCPECSKKSRRRQNNV